MTSQTPTKNYSFHALPISYALAFPPHLYAFTRLTLASNWSTSNTVPRQSFETLRGTISETAWDSIARARGAHLNAFEGWQFFAAAMIAGNVAKLPTRDLNIAAAEYIGARVLYNVVYMTVRSDKAGFLRTGVWAWSIGIPFYILWKAGNKLANGEESKKEL